MKSLTKNAQGATLEELKELRVVWRRQNFQFTREQQERYDLLTQLRRAHVRKYYEDGTVWVGPSNVGKRLEEGDNNWASTLTYVYRQTDYDYYT